MDDRQTNRGLSLRSIDDLERLARLAIESGYTACRKPAEAAMLILTGHELGLSPAQSLRGIYVVSGKPVLSADMMVAVVRRSGLCASWRTVESTPDRCTITTRRVGDDHEESRTWTMADAKRAGITGKGTWAAYPATMLRHRCASDLARQVYPDVILGLYDPEELGAEQDLDGRTEHIDAARAEVSRRLAHGQTAETIEASIRTTLGIDARSGRAERQPPPPETEDEDEGPAPPPAPRPLTDDECEALCGALGVADAATIEGAVTDARSEYPRASTEQRARLTAAVVAARGRLAPPPTPPEDEPPQRPRGRRPRRDAGEHVAVAAPPVADAAPAGDAPAAWRSSLDGVREHLAAIRALPHLEASARRHGRGLASDALALYAERLVALAGDDHSGAWLSTRAATERVARWAAEGPVGRQPAGVRRAA